MGLLDPSDVLRRINDDVGRSLARGKNGLRYVGGVGRPSLEPTPKDVVWSRDKARVYRFRNDDVRYGPPIFIVHSLISRSYVFDLMPGNSLVRELMDAGFDVFLIDWGIPDEADASNGLDRYVDTYLPRALDAAKREARAEEITVIGYCFGGALALLTVAAHPELAVSGLVTMATPADYRHMGMLASLFQQGRLNPESIIDETGNVPAEVIYESFKIIRPTDPLVQYANLWQNLWNDQYVEGYQAMGQWARDHVPFPGRAFSEIVDELVRDNALMHDTMRVGHRRVSLRNVTCPYLNVLAERDSIVPPAAAEPFVELVGSADRQQLRLEAGHVAIIAGRQAAKVMLPSLTQWLADHSDAKDA